MSKKRVFIIILDSCGIGQMPDAARFGDKDCCTLGRISSSPSFCCDNIAKLGLGYIDGIDYIPRHAGYSAAVARLAESSNGKDTTIGHWELAGLISKDPLPTYPNGFPVELLSALSKETGRGILCNKPYSGTEVIRDYGDEHLKTGDLIVYTSADSVCQIAAHEDVVPTELLYEYCKKARSIFSGKHAVGRIIARPFSGTSGAFVRTANRRDFSLEPPKKTLLDALAENGKDVIAVGKINDIFASRGVTEYYLTHSNSEGIDETERLLKKDFCGLCFVNLVDFDSLYGHRQDVDGYAAAFAEFDRRLPQILAGLRDDDILMISADHGCDPGDGHTDHTREYVPLLIYGKNITPKNLDTAENFCAVAATAAEYLGVDYDCPGKSFLGRIMTEDMQ